jgi:hypothetical protein
MLAKRHCTYVRIYRVRRCLFLGLHRIPYDHYIYIYLSRMFRDGNFVRIRACIYSTYIQFNGTQTPQLGYAKWVDPACLLCSVNCIFHIYWGPQTSPRTISTTGHERFRTHFQLSNVVPLLIYSYILWGLCVA